MRFTRTGMNNHELRDVMTALFFSLDKEDRDDWILEIQSYEEQPESYLPAVSSAILRGLRGELREREVDIMAIKRVEKGEL